jgi:hypothetical protein
MKSIRRLIREEYIQMLKEYEDVNWDLYEKQDEMMYKLLDDFLFNNTPELDKRIYWRVVPAARLKKIWEDYIKLGFVRDIKGLDLIEGIMIAAALRLYILTMLSGRTSEKPDEYFEEAWGDYVDDYVGRLKMEDKAEYQDPNQTEIPYDDPTQPYKKKDVRHLPQSFEPNDNYNIENIPFAEYVDEHREEISNMGTDKIRKDLMEILLGHFYDYYSTDSKGHGILSDYGTDPLVKLAHQLAREDDTDKKVVIIDKMLNVAHQSSDLAAWFIEGGSSALSDISGYQEPTQDGWNNTQSKISGQYRMGDYH